jgi:hypothetical protein
VVRIKVTNEDYRKALKKIQGSKISAYDAGKKTVTQLAEIGQAHARMIAPSDKGTLRSLIKVFSGEESQGPYAKLVSQNPVAYTGRLWGDRRFNLVKWMHATRGVFQSDNPFGAAGTKHIKTGSPTYMYRTRDWIKTRVGVVAKANFNKIKF